MMVNIREKYIFKTNENKDLMHGLTIMLGQRTSSAGGGGKIWYDVVIANLFSSSSNAVRFGLVMELYVMCV